MLTCACVVQSLTTMAVVNLRRKDEGMATNAQSSIEVYLLDPTTNVIQILGEFVSARVFGDVIRFETSNQCYSVEKSNVKEVHFH